MDADARVIHRHNHWLRLACTQPLSESFYALVYSLLMYTNNTLFDYKGGPPAPGQKPSSLAQIAADTSNLQSINATACIACTLDHLYTVCILASYLTGEGDPRKALPLSRYPNQVTLTPGWSIGDNERLLRPVRPFATEVDAMTQQQRETMVWPQRFRFIMATVNRFYHDPEHRNGAVLGALFMVLVQRVPEIRERVQIQLMAEGVSEADCATVFAYIADEMFALALSNMDFDSARSHWNGVWSSVCNTLNNDDFARMIRSVEARTNSRKEVADAVRESTERKRQSRAAKKQKKKQTKSAVAAAAAAIEHGDDGGKMAALAGYDDDDDDDSDKELSDAVKTLTSRDQSNKKQTDLAGAKVARAVDAVLETDNEEDSDAGSISSVADDDDDDLTGIVFD